MSEFLEQLLNNAAKDFSNRLQQKFRRLGDEGFSTSSADTKITDPSLIALRCITKLGLKTGCSYQQAFDSAYPSAVNALAAMQTPGFYRDEQEKIDCERWEIITAYDPEFADRVTQLFLQTNHIIPGMTEIGTNVSAEAFAQLIPYLANRFFDLKLARFCGKPVEQAKRSTLDYFGQKPGEPLATVVKSMALNLKEKGAKRILRKDTWSNTPRQQVLYSPIEGQQIYRQATESIPDFWEQVAREILYLSGFRTEMATQRGGRDR